MTKIPKPREVSMTDVRSWDPYPFGVPVALVSFLFQPKPAQIFIGFSDIMPERMRTSISELLK